jgi:hypothetical protein
MACALGGTSIGYYLETDDVVHISSGKEVKAPFNLT